MWITSDSSISFATSALKLNRLVTTYSKDYIFPHCWWLYEYVLCKVQFYCRIDMPNVIVVLVWPNSLKTMIASYWSCTVWVLMSLVGQTQTRHQTYCDIGSNHCFLSVEYVFDDIYYKRYVALLSCINKIQHLLMSQILREWFFVYRPFFKYGLHKDIV